MNVPIEEAQRMLQAAERDHLSFQLLRETGRAPHETMGFLAQQTCEKLIKSAMLLHRIPVERTHDLEFLYNRSLEAGLVLPVAVQSLRLLNPYAVAVRYEGLEVEWIGMVEAEQLVLKLLEFAQRHLHNAQDGKPTQ